MGLDVKAYRDHHAHGQKKPSNPTQRLHLRWASSGPSTRMDSLITLYISDVAGIA
jgi:hypothetical protein